MELEKQVVSLELAKRMKELGADYISQFYWTSKYAYKEAEFRLYEFVYPTYVQYPAYTVAELGEMLKDTFGDGSPFLCWPEWDTTNKEWGPGYFAPINEELDNKSSADTEANSRAKMWIWLRENGHI